MKKITLVLLALTAVVPLFGRMNGRQIAHRVRYGNEPRSSVTRAKILLYKSARASSPSEIRNVTMKGKKGSGWKKNAFRFTNSSYRGTTFLSLEKRGVTTFYIYLNSVGRARRLSANEKQNNFIDTDFSNEDLGGIKLNDYRFKRISDMKRGGKVYYRVWGYRKDRQTKYPKYLAIVDPSNFVMVEARIFNKSGRLGKIMRASNVRRVAGRYHIPFRIEVRDLVANHKTVIRISSMKVNRWVSNSVFRPFNMSRAWR